MKKMRLNLDALTVDSFPTREAAEARGTVLAWDAFFRFTVPNCSGQITCGCACSATNGVVVCKSCGPSCYE